MRVWVCHIRLREAHVIDFGSHEKYSSCGSLGIDDAILPAARL